MKHLKIIQYPNSILLKKCSMVRPKNNIKEVQQLIDKMFSTMKFHEGIGLAAPQVGISLNVIVIDLQDGSPSYSMINPKIIDQVGKQTILEGCLSVPHIQSHIERDDVIKVEYLDYDGKPQTLTTNGLLSAVCQHECQHLEGKLFIDHFSRLKREMMIKRFKKTGRI